MLAVAFFFFFPVDALGNAGVPPQEGIHIYVYLHISSIHILHSF